MKANENSYSSNIYVVSSTAVRNVQPETAIHEESALFKGETIFFKKIQQVCHTHDLALIVQCFTGNTAKKVICQSEKSEGSRG